MLGLGLTPHAPTRTLNVSRLTERRQTTDLDSETSLDVPVYETELWTSRQRQAVRTTGGKTIKQVDAYRIFSLIY